MEAYGGDRGNILVIEFESFEADSLSVMTSINIFLGLSNHEFDVSQVFNSRNNRGVHGADSNAGIGGVINGVSKNVLGKLESWSTSLSTAALAVLKKYFTSCNNELRLLLRGNPQIRWLL